MFRYSLLVLIGMGSISAASAQTMTLALSSDDFQVTNVFSNVDEFSIIIEIDAPLEAGTFNNPDIVDVMYTVTGDLAAGTPSGFPSFALVRNISGTDFYAQGSSLSFEISANAVLDDGVQIAELVGNGLVFTFNGKEIGNGRFHPALLELNSDGTGRIQNSDNIVSEVPLQQVAFGQEYITDLTFDPGNTTLLALSAGPGPIPGGGGGTLSPLEVVLSALLALFAVLRAGRTSGPLRGG